MSLVASLCSSRASFLALPWVAALGHPGPLPGPPRPLSEHPVQPADQSTCHIRCVDEGLVSEVGVTLGHLAVAMAKELLHFVERPAAVDQE